MKIIRNVFSAIIGVPLYYIVSSILLNIFNFIVQIPFLTSIFSYPSSPEWWAMTGTIIASMAITSFAISKISDYKKIDFSVIITFVVIGLISIAEIIAQFYMKQATFGSILLQIFTIGSCVFACCEISRCE